MIRIGFYLPVDFDREELRESIEAMYPAPRDRDGYRLYYPVSSRLFEHQVISSNCHSFGSSSAGDDRGIDESTSYNGKVEEIYKFWIFRESPIIRFCEETTLVVSLGRGDQKTSYREEPYLFLSISTANPGFMSRDSYEHCMLTPDGFTFHELADLEQSFAASRFVGEFLRRLSAKVSDETLEHISLAFDISEQNNLLADYVDNDEVPGFSLKRVKRWPVSIVKVIDLVDALSSASFEPTIINLFKEAAQKERPRTDLIINHVRSYLRGTEELPLPALIIS